VSERDLAKGGERSVKRKKKKTRGRKPELTDRMISDICDAVRVGLRVQRAAKVVALREGLHQATAYRWVERAMGPKPVGVYARLRDRVQQAETEFELVHLMNIAVASTKDWRASAYALENVLPGEYGRAAQEGALPTQPMPVVLEPDAPLADAVPAEYDVVRELEEIEKRKDEPQ
jgi:hypothetical protein